MLTTIVSEQDIKNLILMCKRQGPHYTAQTVLWELDEVLKKSKYIPFTIKLMKIRKKIVKTDTKETSLTYIYKDILDVLNNSKMSDLDTLKLKNFIEALLKLEI